MTTGRDEPGYYGNIFRTLLEARWAVFFTTLDDQWHYEPDGWRIGNPEHYRPQLWIQRFDGDIYLEAQPEWSRDSRRPMLHTDPEIAEHHVYLAAGDLPTEGQLRDVGWWDPAGRGVLQLTAGYDWAALYPPDSDDVLAALETAHAETFEPRIALPRWEGEQVHDVTVERRHEASGNDRGS